jgi:hypothetical protein
MSHQSTTDTAIQDLLATRLTCTCLLPHAYPILSRLHQPPGAIPPQSRQGHLHQPVTTCASPSTSLRQVAYSGMTCQVPPPQGTNEQYMPVNPSKPVLMTTHWCTPAERHNTCLKRHMPTQITHHNQPHSQSNADATPTRSPCESAYSQPTTLTAHQQRTCR